MIPFLRFWAFSQAFHACLLYMFCVWKKNKNICDIFSFFESVEIHAVGFLKQIIHTQYCLTVESHTVMTTYIFNSHKFYIMRSKTGKFYLPYEVDYVCCQMIYFAFMEIMCSSHWWFSCPCVFENNFKDKVVEL